MTNEEWNQKIAGIHSTTELFERIQIGDVTEEQRERDDAHETFMEQVHESERCGEPF